MRRLLILLALLVLPSLASAREAWRGFCEIGDRSVVTSGISSTTKVQLSAPSCQILILVHGGGVATIYADNNGTPLANPFQANLDGSWIAYMSDGRYDIQESGGALPVPFTYLDVLICDSFVAGAVCSGASSGAHNLLSTTHLDTIPFSPPVRGDIITAQNLTSPSAVTPAWSRLPLGANTFVLTSNGVDAIWAPVAGGSGCTLPGTDKGVLSEHPVGTCHDSTNWTWDDTNLVNLQGDGTNTVSLTNTLVFSYGLGNTQADATRSWAIGDTNSVTCDANTVGNGTCSNLYQIGRSQGITATGASSRGSFVYQLGERSTVSSTAGSHLNDVITMLDFNAIAAGTGGSIDHVMSLGKTNTVQANGATTITSSAFQLGETNTINSSSGADDEDNFQIGENNNIAGTAAGVQVGTMIQLGWNHSFFAATPSVIMNFGSALGHANTTSDGSGATASMTDFVMVGHAIHLLNCSDCFAMGKNIDQTAVNNTLFLGMSASDIGLVITNSGGSHDNVRRTPMPFTSLPSCAAGTEGSFASITTSNSATNGVIITGGGTNHVLGFCDGTNWKVVVGT